METEEKKLKAEKRCTELAIQLEKARDENEKKILESEVEILLLRREEKLKDERKEEFEENCDWTSESSLKADVGERESPVSVGNPHFHQQSLAAELGCAWNGVVKLALPLVSSQEVASQTDLFANELEGLKRAMADDSPERKHFAIEGDDCSPEEKEGEKKKVVVDYGKPGSALEDEADEETETSLEEELMSSVLHERGHELQSTEGRACSQQQESMKALLREGKLGSPFCGKSNILGMEMLAHKVESCSPFERETRTIKPSSVDCSVNTEAPSEEKEVPKKTVAGFVKSLLAWLLLFLTLFTTFGAVRVDHKVHLPSTWLLLHHIFGSFLPLPIISIAFDSNPRPHIN